MYLNMVIKTRGALAGCLPARYVDVEREKWSDSVSYYFLHTFFTLFLSVSCSVISQHLPSASQFERDYKGL